LPPPSVILELFSFWFLLKCFDKVRLESVMASVIIASFLASTISNGQSRQSRLTDSTVVSCEPASLCHSTRDHGTKAQLSINVANTYKHCCMIFSFTSVLRHCWLLGDRNLHPAIKKLGVGLLTVTT